MNRFEQAAEFGAMMGKSAGIFWKKLDKPVGIKSIFGNEDDPAGPDDPVDFDRSTVHARLGAYRTMEPRLLTRLFSSPSKDYKNMLEGMQAVVDRDPAPGKGGTGLESPIGRAVWASSALPSMFPDRYSFGTDAQLGNEDVFEDTRTPYYKGMQEHFKKRLSPFPEAWKQITNPEILNQKAKGGGIKIEDIKPEAFEDKDEDLGEDSDWINELHNKLMDPNSSVNSRPDRKGKAPKSSKKGPTSKAAEFGAMMGKQAGIKAAKCWSGYERVPGTTALTPGSCRPIGKKKKESEKKAESPIDFYNRQQAQQIAEMKAQAAALRAHSGVTGPGGGTVQGHLKSDGKGGWVVDNSSYTPQEGYNRQGFKMQQGQSSSPMTAAPSAPAPSAPAPTTPAPRSASGLRANPAFSRVPMPSRPSLRNDPRFKEDFDEMAEEQAKIKQLQDATSGKGNGQYEGTFRQGKLQPGATFTPKAQPEAYTPSNVAPRPQRQVAQAYTPSSSAYAPRSVNPLKPVDISGDRRRKEVEMGWAPNSMDQGGDHYADNGPRSAELVRQANQGNAAAKAPAPAKVPAPAAKPSYYSQSRFNAPKGFSQPTGGYNPYGINR
jgi:hypothetical protein